MKTVIKLLSLFLAFTCVSQSDAMLRVAAHRLRAVAPSMAQRMAFKPSFARSFNGAAKTACAKRPTTSSLSRFATLAATGVTASALSEQENTASSPAPSKQTTARPTFEIENGKPKINYEALQLEQRKPTTEQQLMHVLGWTFMGFLGGAVLSAITNSKSLNEVGGGALVGLGIGISTSDEPIGYYKNREDFAFKTVFEKSKGLNLHGAAAQNNVTGIKHLLAYGLDPVARDKQGRTPLMYASAIGANEAVDTLMHRTPAYTFSPYYAYLLKSIDLQDNQKNTAILYAAQCGNANTTAKLFAYGADANIKNHEGHNVSTFAQQNNDIKKALEQEAN
jgi:hypothetical protein